MRLMPLQTEKVVQNVALLRLKSGNGLLRQSPKMACSDRLLRVPCSQSHRSQKGATNFDHKTGCIVIQLLDAIRPTSSQGIAD